MKLNQQFAVALIICLTICLFLGVLPPKFNGQGYDYQFHFDKARGQDESNGKVTVVYPPLFHWLAGPFSFNEPAFYLFSLFLIGILTPMLLFYLTDNWVSVAFYFAVSEYFWFFEQGVYAQALIGIFLILVLMFDDWGFRAILLLLATLSHSTGFFAIGLTMLVLALHESGLLKKAVGFLPGCSGLVGNKRPDTLLDTRIIELVDSHQSLHGFRVSYILKLAFQIFPLPFLFMSMKYLWKHKLDYFLLIIAFVIVGFFLNYRVWYFITIPGIFGLTRFYENMNNPNLKKLFWILVILFGIFQFYMWFNYKWSCFPL